MEQGLRHRSSHGSHSLACGDHCMDRQWYKCHGILNWSNMEHAKYCNHVVDASISGLCRSNLLDGVPSWYIQVLYCASLPGFAIVLRSGFLSLGLSDFHQEKR